MRITILLAIVLTTCIAIFFLPPAVALSLVLPLGIASGILEHSILKPGKRLVYLLLYFLPILLIQAFHYRGNVYILYPLRIDAFGVRHTATYFIRILAFMYVLTCAISVLRKVPLPHSRIGTELFMLYILFRQTKKGFLNEFRLIMKTQIHLRDIPYLFARIVDATYQHAFRLYPFRRLLRREDR